MARNLGASCKQCRREGMKLFLKGERCESERCAVKKRPFPPGEHGQRRGKLSDYGIQLREKQKTKRMYGMSEKQFRNYFKIADAKTGVTGDNLLVMLETRFDNILYRLGFAISRSQARQLAGHRHFLVDGKTLTIASCQIKPGQVISVRAKSKDVLPIRAAVESSKLRGVVDWMELDAEKLEGKLIRLPTREELALPVKEQLIVELYSK